MRIVYFGTPSEAVLPLAELIEKSREWDCEIVGVVSQPARPAGRNRILTDPPVAAFAKAKGLCVLQPEKASSPEFLDSFRKLRPDVAITAAYGQILSDAFLQIPLRATINIHPSLLPKYRGATPVPAAILAGDKISGVTILFTIKALDAGNIIIQERASILPNERSDQLTERMFALGGQLLGKAFDLLRDEKFVGQPQDPELVSFCRKIKKEDGLIDWNAGAAEIVNKFRAFFPWPGSFSVLGGKVIVITDMKVCEDQRSIRLKAGEFLFCKASRSLLVGSGDPNPVSVHRLIPAGSKEQDAAAFWNGAGQKAEAKYFGSKIEL